MFPSDLPFTPQQVRTLFQCVRNNMDDTPDYARTASLIMQGVEQKLYSKYGHYPPGDWYDMPEASVLDIGAAAAHRIAGYTPEVRPAVNDRVKQWHFTLRAHACCLEPESGNRVMDSVAQYGHYIDSISLTGPE